MVTEKDAEAYNIAVTSILRLFSHDVKVLVDPKSTHIDVY